MEHRSLPQKVILALSTFFGTGYLPLVPGTFGSLAGLLIYFLVKDHPVFFLFSTLACILVGFYVCGRAENILGKKDAKQIVIDEVSGMLVSLMYLPYDFRIVLIAFIIFRILDTFKPYPAHRFQAFKGGLGVMSDDLIAGIYTNLIIQVALRLAVLRAS
ncbi:MAG: phosphatidylglycerophosphatase A [Candidatus Omnitrophota bacterium]